MTYKSSMDVWIAYIILYQLKQDHVLHVTGGAIG